MAMEKLYAVRDTHTRSITALGYNPARREILMGCEDGVIKTWESESGKQVSVTCEHKGWITDFLYWTETKLMLSSANDRNIIAWAPGGGIHDRITIGVPVYCMAINLRRFQLVCGVNGGIRVYALDENKESGHVINCNRVLYVAKEHTDIVRCIICTDTRTYSAGYDQRLIIYDSSFTGDNSLEAINIINNAHDAGISILTGSFDKSVKIWTADGKPVHKLDNFISTVSGICYVPRNKTVWVAGGSSYASLFDPKSGDNVSDFIGTFQQQEEEKYHLQILKFFPELNQVVASTSRRHLIVWKYNPSGCVTALKCKVALESLCYTRKVPILIFSGDHEGAIVKWERMQSNHFMYSKEAFVVSDSKIKKKRKTGSKKRELMLEQELSDKLNNMSMKTEEMNKANNKNIQSHYAFNKPIIPPASTHNHPHTTILRCLFVESLDIILAASEDTNILSVLQDMKPLDMETLVNKYSILLDSDSELLPQNTKDGESDSVTNRVAGFVCKYVFCEHESCVTSLVVIEKENSQDSTYLLSGGWDRRICIWDLEAGRREFAYASSDKMVYIRKFSTTGSKMTLVNTLQGHDAEVTCVCWNTILTKWVTGSDDGTIRIWSGSGLNECEQILSAQGGVHCLCMDKINGAIVAGIQNVIRVYDPEFYRLMQTNVGHSDAVRDIIHIKERNQYVSCSWDQSIRVWNAWKKQVKRKDPEEGGENKGDNKMKKVEISLEEEEEENEEQGEEETNPESPPPEESESQAGESGTTGQT
ncbi:MHCKB-like protein [Mya arenaria]|uniref:MHCKB-like protein n=1 Tax=Mya arenaria TaxID=6604 RepID=A0ABY7DQA5_MYAAR|nr:MHCKB-like protein [Mya arenaria]